MAGQVAAGSAVAYYVARRAVRHPGVSSEVAARHGYDCGAWVLSYVFGPLFWSLALLPCIAGGEVAASWWAVEAALAVWIGKRLATFVKVSPAWSVVYRVPTEALASLWFVWMVAGLLFTILMVFSA
jgi:hypothetical protein